MSNTITDESKTYTTKHEYDVTGREIKITSYTGREIFKFYDEAGRVTQAGSASEGWMRYTYNDDGTVKSVKDQRGFTSSFEYNPEHQITSYTDADKKIFTTYYDRLGRLVKTIDAEKNVRVYKYDEIGRLVAETTPTNTNLTYQYDGWGNVVKHTDARGTVFSREFTDNNLLRKETAQNASLMETLMIAYDEAGAVTSADNGIRTLFNYIDSNYQPNAYGTLAGVTTGVGGVSLSMSYEYDSAMRLNKVTMPDKNSVVYAYNTTGELSGVQDWLNSAGITYDNGRLKNYTTVSGLEKKITYDTADRITSLAYTSDSVTHKSYSFGYDEASNVIRKNQNEYTYDALNRLKTSYEYGWFQKQPKDIAPDYGEVPRDYTGTAPVTYSIKAMDSKDYTVVFDAASKSLACDLLTPLWVNKIELHPAIVAHRVKKEDIAIYYFPRSGSSEEWVRLEEYDIEKDGETGALVVYFHKAVETRYLKVSSIWDDRDVDNQSVFAFATFTNTVSDLFRVWTLSTSHTESYEYDAVGNRVSLNSDGTVSGSEYYKNSMNGNTCRIRKDGEWFYLYDRAGNRVERGRAVTGTGDAIAIDPSEEHWSYTWDLHNRLVRVESSTGVSVSYAYDAQNHRVKREGKDGTTVYAYGRNGALTYQKNLTSGLERSFTYLGSTLLGWTETVGGESHKFFAVTDALGSVTQIRDEENNVVWDGEYAPFGTLTAAVGKKRFGGMFTGKDIDPETGLTYHWHRWRSEDGTSFISEDPARDGINWYGYVAANPLRYTDPTGLDPHGMTREEADERAWGPTNNGRNGRTYDYEKNGYYMTDMNGNSFESDAAAAAAKRSGKFTWTKKSSRNEKGHTPDPAPVSPVKTPEETDKNDGAGKNEADNGPGYITGNNHRDYIDPDGREISFSHDSDDQVITIGINFFAQYGIVGSSSGSATLGIFFVLKEETNPKLYTAALFAAMNFNPRNPLTFRPAIMGLNFISKNTKDIGVFVAPEFGVGVGWGLGVSASAQFSYYGDFSSFEKEFSEKAAGLTIGFITGSISTIQKSDNFMKLSLLKNGDLDNFSYSLGLSLGVEEMGWFGVLSETRTGYTFALSLGDLLE